MGGFDYPYGFSYEMGLMPEMVGSSVFGIFIILYILVMLLSFGLSIVVYVLHSLSLYTIANRRGIRHGWLAWIPVGNMWLLGSISDQYQYVAKGNVKNRRKVLLGLSIALIVVYVGWIFSMIMSIILSEGVGSGAAMAVALSLLGMLALSVLAIVLTVYQYIAYYDLFRSSEPNNAVLYLVLSIVFNITLPFFVFACRKKDGGMPPRKQPVQPVNVYPTEPVNAYPTEPVNAYPTEPVEEGFAQPEEFEDE